MYNFPERKKIKICICLPKRLKGSIFFIKTGRARVDEKRIEEKSTTKKNKKKKKKKKNKKKTTKKKKKKKKQQQKKKKTPNPTCCNSICLCQAYLKDDTALLHSIKTPPTITRKYAFMVIPRINIKSLT